MSRVALTDLGQPLKRGTEIINFGDFIDGAGGIATVAGYTGRKRNDTAGVTSISYASETSGAMTMGATFSNSSRWVAIDVEKDTAWDFTGVTDMLLEIGYDAMPSGGDCTYFGVRVCFMYDTGTTDTNFLWSPSTYTGTGIPRQGRMTVRFNPQSMTVANGGETKATIMAATKRIQLRMYVTGYGYGTGAEIPVKMRVRKLYMNAYQRPKIAFSFDDCHPSVATFVKPIFDTYGWRAGLGINGATITDPTSYGLVAGTSVMTTAQVQSCYDAGWEIYNHAWEHRPILDRLSLSSYTPTGHGLGDRIAVLNSKYATEYTVGQDITILAGVDPSWCGTFEILAKTESGASFPNDTEGTITIQLAVVPNMTSGFGYLWAAPAGGFAAYKVAQIDTNTAYCRANSWVRGNDILLYPNGAYSNFASDYVEGWGFRAGRSVRYHYDHVSGGALNGVSHYEFGGVQTFDDWADFYDLPILPMDDSISEFDTAVELLAAVDRVIAQGGICLPYGHTFTGSGSSNFETAEASAFFAGIRSRELQGLIDVVTISDIVDSFLGVPLVRPSAERVDA